MKDVQEAGAMDKSMFVDTLLAERARWEALLAQATEAQMTEPGVAGEWSINDIVAHVTWGERELVGWLQARALVGSDLWELSEDERNAAVFAENRHRPLRDVLVEAQHVHPQLVAALRSLDDEDFTDARRFREMPADWVPWQVAAGNSFKHYRDHTPSISAWLAAH
jgi:Mycothiol maleylpyruvate isomerase N-terminal domain